MNVQISTYVDFSGMLEELDPLLDAISDAVVQCGYGSDDSEDGMVNSMIVVTPSRLEEYEDATSFAMSLVEQGIVLILPMKNKEAKDERTGN